MFVFSTCESQNFQSFMLHVIDAHLWKLTYMNNQGMLQPKSVFLYFMRMVLSVCLLQKWFHAFTSINCAFNRPKNTRVLLFVRNNHLQQNCTLHKVYIWLESFLRKQIFTQNWANVHMQVWIFISEVKGTY